MGFKNLIKKGVSRYEAYEERELARRRMVRFEKEAERHAKRKSIGVRARAAVTTAKKQVNPVGLRSFSRSMGYQVRAEPIRKKVKKVRLIVRKKRRKRRKSKRK